MVFLPEKENFLALPEEWSQHDNVGTIIQSVPFETTSTYGHGSCDGPKAVIAASHEVELFDAVLGFEPYACAEGIGTLPAMPVQGLEGDAVAKALYAETVRWLRSGKFVVTLGGEHTSVIGGIQAHTEAYPECTVLQFDAHSDLRPAYQDNAWNHACAMARVLDFHPALVQVGIRSQEAEERLYSEEQEIPVFYAHEIHEADRAGKDWIGEIIQELRGQVYITFDCDVFDPSLIPATGTPEPGGLTWEQMNALFARIAKERTIVGCDFSELAPIPSLRHPQFTIAKLIYRLIGLKSA